MLNTGKSPVFSSHDLLTTIAYSTKDELAYGLEGSIFNAGTAVKWLRDELCLIKQADVITLHVPLIDSTKGFIDAEKLGWMKDGAALVNTARGPIVEEYALFEEIKSGRLRAAFDVFWEEPYNGKLKQFHPINFLMSPHVSSNCENFLTGLAQDLTNYLNRNDYP